MKKMILSHLPGDFPWQVHWFHTIDSTNTRAKRMAQEGAPHGTVLIAGQQTGGRGRLGRSFSSPAGAGLYLSVVLRPNCKATALMHLTCAAGVAACNAVQQCCGIRPGIKWINDLIIDDRKLGGILTELSVDPKTGLVDYAVIGIGINCFQSPEDFPPELQNIAISLKIAGHEPEIPQLAAAVLLSLYEMSRQLSHRNTVISAYRRNCVTLGRDVMIIQGEETQNATALDVNEDGALIVRLTDGAVKTIHSGEVSIRGINGYA